MDKRVESVLIEIEEIATNLAKLNAKEMFLRENSLFPKFDELCQFYLQMDDDTRKEIRDYIHSIKGGVNLPYLIYVVPDALYSYIKELAKRIKSPEDENWLRLALAAASIEDAISDYRDLLVSLGELYLSCEKAGIDPNSYFQDIAQISGTNADLLRNFHKSEHLKSIR